MKYIELFFQEKNLPFEQWEIIDTKGDYHIIDNEFVIDLLLNTCGRGEQEQAADVIRKIDFANGDVNHFLRHLAQGYVNTHYAEVA